MGNVSDVGQHMSKLLDDVGAMFGVTPMSVTERQEAQWQLANRCLDDAVDAISLDRDEHAIACALTGLLALQVSVR